jgi:hypothetical protein
MTEPDPNLRGKCLEYAEAAVAADPTLTLVRGWYHDPAWGTQEHWWTTRHDGTIHDPTAGQFPMGGIAALYEEYAGSYPCRECGTGFDPALGGYEGCCSYECFGHMVGVPVGTRLGDLR